MAINKTNRLAWIVKTIFKAEKITFEELARKWDEDDNINENRPLSRKSFHTWVWNILDTFGVNIECDKHDRCYQYYIANAEDLLDGGIDNWLLNTATINNLLISCKSIKDRIILESVPSGLEYLDKIIEALKQNRCIHIVYKTYWKDEEKQHYLMPLCVKLFRQRWYMVGQVWANGERLLFCLDRIKDFRFSSHTFDYPADFSPEKYFDGCIGVITSEDVDIQEVKLKVDSDQANYLRDLPLHESQREIKRTKLYSIFTMRLRPTFDFQQEILWNREKMEVLEPFWLRKEIAGIIKRMWNKYQND